MDFKCDACGASYHMGPGFQGHTASCTKCHKGHLVPSFHHDGGTTTAVAEAPSVAKPALKPHPVHRPRLGARTASAPAKSRKALIWIIAAVLLAAAAGAGIWYFLVHMR